MVTKLLRKVRKGRFSGTNSQGAFKYVLTSKICQILEEKERIFRKNLYQIQLLFSGFLNFNISLRRRFLKCV